MIIEKEFTTEQEMLHWLSDENNIAKLKAKYPKSSGAMNLEEKRIEITLNET